MNLRITNNNNFFKLKGILDRNNMDVFQQEFNNIFDRVSNLTISIEEIEWMDKYGVKVSTIGLGCKELYEHFKYKTTA